MNRIEVISRNDPNGSEYSLLIQIITAISSAAAAIGGGYLASRYSHTHAMKIEKLRYDNESRKQEQIEVNLQKQKETHSRYVMESTLHELRNFSTALKVIMEESNWKDNEKYHLIIAKSRWQTFSMNFLTIPYDTKILLFPPNVLRFVQQAYVFFQAFSKVFLPFVDDYSANPTGNFSTAVNELQPTGVKNFVEAE